MRGASQAVAVLRALVPAHGLGWTRSGAALGFVLARLAGGDTLHPPPAMSGECRWRVCGPRPRCGPKRKRAGCYVAVGADGGCGPPSESDVARALSCLKANVTTELWAPRCTTRDTGSAVARGVLWRWRRDSGSGSGDAEIRPTPPSGVQRRNGADWAECR